MKDDSLLSNHLSAFPFACKYGYSELVEKYLSVRGKQIFESYPLEDSILAAAEQYEFISIYFFIFFHF